MNAQFWLIIEIVGFSLAAILLVASVFVFLKLNVLGVIGDLTGRTVAREIQAMREENAQSGDKLHKSSVVNQNRVKLTEKVGMLLNGGSSRELHAASRLTSKEADISTEDDSFNRTLFSRGKKTKSLTAANMAVSQNNNANTNELPDSIAATSVMNSEIESGTTVLDQTSHGEDTVVLMDNQIPDEEPVVPVAFQVVRSMEEVHTDEVIE